MKKALSSLLSFLVVFIGCNCAFANTALQAVDGYYLISNADDLYTFAAIVNNGESSANAKLTNDIVINENLLDENGNLNSGEFKEWYPIGDKNTYARINNIVYNGIFDGQNHTISGLYYNSVDNYRDDSSIGLFGTIGTGTVKNVVIKDSYLNASYHIGTVTGTSTQGTVVNCSSYATVNGASNVGGIIGSCTDVRSTISDCKFYGNVSATGMRVAGICANFYYGTIEYCVNYGTVTGANSVVAGIVGGAGDYDEVCHITGCSNYGNVSTVSSSYNYIGGIVAFATNIDIKDCLNAGNVTSTSSSSFITIGGIFAYGHGKISNCLNVGNITTTTTNDRNAQGGVVGSATNNTKYSTTFSNNYYMEGSSPYGISEYGTGETGKYTYNIIDESGQVEMITSNHLKDGSLLPLLQNGETDSPWSQIIGTDNHPVIVAPLNYNVTAHGGSIRIYQPGLRFGFSFDDTQGADVEEYGFVYSYSALDDFDINTEGIKKKVANNLIDHGDYTTFNLVFTNIPASAYDQTISARAYVKIGGKYFYSPILQRNFNGVAQAILDDEAIDQATKDAVNKLLNKEI